MREPSNKAGLADRGSGQVLQLYAEAPEGSEDAMALEFVSRHSNEFKHSDGMGWMRKKGNVWARDDQNKRFDLARRVAREEASREKNQLIKRRIASAATVAAILRLSQSDERIALTEAAWDAKPDELNTPAGIVDLRTGRLKASKNYLTQISQVAPSLNSPRPLWDKFLNDVFGRDKAMIDFVQRLVGYLLTGERSEQKIFFSYGLGANGKSTFWDLIGWIIGTYGHKLPAVVLMQAKNDRHPTELAQLRGKRLAISSELDEGQFWAESRIKELTGDETLTARYMRQDFFEFRQTQKHMILGNYKPRLRGGDAALARRFVIIPFNAVFSSASCDSRIIDKLKAEAPAILAWAIEGAVAWYSDGLAIPVNITSATAEYMRDNDELEIWLEECVVKDPVSSSKASLLYQNYSNWAKARGGSPLSMHLWGDRMSAAKGISKHTSNGVRYRGLRLDHLTSE